MLIFETITVLAAISTLNLFWNMATGSEGSREEGEIDNNPPPNDPSSSDQPRQPDLVTIPRSEWEAMQATMAALQSTVSNLQVTANRPSTSQVNQPSTSDAEELKALRAKLKEPKVFAAADKQSPTDFINACKRFFVSGRYHDSAVQVAMASTWLIGTAAQWFEREANKIGDSFDVFADKFLEHFEHKQRAKNARAKLDTVRMQGRLSEYDAFVKEFTRLVSECEHLCPDAYTLRTSFMKGLTANMKERLISYAGGLDTWEEARDAGYEIDDKSKETAFKRNEPDSGKKPDGRFDGKKQKSTPPSQGQAPSKSNGKNKAGAVPSLPTDQHLALKTAGLCWRCGESGHQKPKCTKSPSDAVASRKAALAKLGF